VKFFFIDMLLMAAVLSIQAVRTVQEYNIGSIVHCQCVGLRDLLSGCW
jgi:hypothetical protein